MVESTNVQKSEVDQPQPAQEQPAQEQPAQEQPAQEQPAQEQPAQEQPDQPEEQEVSNQDEEFLTTLDAELKPIKLFKLYNKLETLSIQLQLYNIDNSEIKFFLSNIPNFSYDTSIFIILKLLDKYHKSIKQNIQYNIYESSQISNSDYNIFLFGMSSNRLSETNILNPQIHNISPDYILSEFKNDSQIYNNHILINNNVNNRLEEGDQLLLKEKYIYDLICEYNDYKICVIINDIHLRQSTTKRLGESSLLWSKFKLDPNVVFIRSNHKTIL